MTLLPCFLVRKEKSIIFLHHENHSGIEAFWWGGERKSGGRNVSL